LRRDDGKYESKILKTMEIKKNPKADLEKNKTLGFLMGAVVGLAFLFVGFEWGERDRQITIESGIATILLKVVSQLSFRKKKLKQRYKRTHLLRQRRNLK